MLARVLKPMAPDEDDTPPPELNIDPIDGLCFSGKARTQQDDGGLISHAAPFTANNCIFRHGFVVEASVYLPT